MGAVAVRAAAAAGAWLKPRAMTRTERFISVPLMVFVFFLIFAFFGIPPLHVVPVWGPSMQPTLQIWNLPAPLERFSLSGWIHYDPNKKPEVGSIVYFRIPDTRLREVKRVARVEPDKGLWVVPDNQGVSGEGSDNSDLYDWIPGDCVLGIVDSIYTPKTFVRSFSEVGKWQNLIEFSFPPRQARFSPSRERVALIFQENVLIADYKGNSILVKNCSFSEWKSNNQFTVFVQKGGREYEKVICVDPDLKIKEVMLTEVILP